MSLQTHTQNMWYLLLFHCNSRCTNAPQCYVIRTLAVLLLFLNGIVETEIANRMVASFCDNGNVKHENKIFAILIFVYCHKFLEINLCWQCFMASYCGLHCYASGYRLYILRTPFTLTSGTVPYYTSFLYELTHQCAHHVFYILRVCFIPLLVFKKNNR